MENPFLKRASEHLHDDAAFLAIVSPEPIKHFLGPLARNGTLYDRLVIVRGTPGSGKTTLARLFEYPTINTLLRNTSIDAYKAIVSALNECGAIDDQGPKFVSARLPMETDYRDFWEFHYSAQLKAGLLTSMLQARAVLTWIRHIVSAGHPLESIEIVIREGSEIAADAIGGTDVASVVERARDIEARIYGIIGALVPPKEDDLDTEITSAYRPFDVLEKFKVNGENGQVLLAPLVVLDDAHSLHPVQFEHLRRWLCRRELRVSRWILTRLDVMNPSEALSIVAGSDDMRVQLPGTTATRDYVYVFLQGNSENRRGQRDNFRKLARDMSDRYLRNTPLLYQRGINKLKDLMSDEIPTLAETQLSGLENSLIKEVKRLKIPDTEFESIQAIVSEYLTSKRLDCAPIQLAMTKVLVNRYSVRNPQSELFETPDSSEQSRPLKADASVFDAARIHLHHTYEYPYFYGINDICDAGSENAEQFLHLAAELVDVAITRSIRGKSAVLRPKQQCRLLREKAKLILERWDFPYHDRVKELTTKMAQKCKDKSLELNAPLGAGANAFGILQSEFETLATKNPEFAQILKFALAYNALSLVPNYSCQNKQWCLLELGGLVILNNGLTLKRGGFIESSTLELTKFIEDGKNE